MSKQNIQLDEQAKENVRKALHTICQTAVQAAATLDEYGEELTGQMEQAAEAIVSTFGIEEDAIEEFRTTVSSAKENQILPEKVPTKREVAEAIDMIYAMCDYQTEVKTVMRYVRIAGEVMFVWYPDMVA